MGPLATGLLVAGGSLLVLKMGKAKGPTTEPVAPAGTTAEPATTGEPATRNPPEPLLVAGASGQAPLGTPAPLPEPSPTIKAALTTATAPLSVKAGTCSTTTCPSTPTAGAPSTQELDRVMTRAALSTRILF